MPRLRGRYAPSRHMAAPTKYDEALLEPALNRLAAKVERVDPNALGFPAASPRRVGVNAFHLLRFDYAFINPSPPCPGWLES